MGRYNEEEEEEEEDRVPDDISQIYQLGGRTAMQNKVSILSFFPSIPPSLRRRRRRRSPHVWQKGGKESAEAESGEKKGERGRRLCRAFRPSSLRKMSGFYINERHVPYSTNVQLPYSNLQNIAFHPKIPKHGSTRQYTSRYSHTLPCI